MWKIWPLHWHRYRAVDVQHMRYAKTGGEVTSILRVCSCGKINTQDVSGHWPKEYFLPK